MLVLNICLLLDFNLNQLFFFNWKKHCVKFMTICWKFLDLVETPKTMPNMDNTQNAYFGKPDARDKRQFSRIPVKKGIEKWFIF